MMISGETPLPSDTPVEKSEARYTVKGLLGKQVLYTARQEGRVLTLDAPMTTPPSAPPSSTCRP